MVCSNENPRRFNFIERAEILGISIDRAMFLSACALNDDGKAKDGISSRRGLTIKYDDRVQLAEASRLGIGLADTAEMMGMTQEQVLSYGIPFKKKSTLPRPPGPGGIYNLLPTYR
ncbi:hypothetical protein UFOVP1118_15 [uncultured Caudovirales phage]|uniref:Uncharacterized protein n=1 Tax=uncultured Caudovirales phage TaxID=2100421 RepID=A0A6J5QZW5_9CAUD|nr:hypothetical protein UFOVP1118_15 [uncultured Caudovirales phage]